VIVGVGGIVFVGVIDGVGVKVLVGVIVGFWVGVILGVGVTKEGGPIIQHSYLPTKHSL
jgi:hypothetical protein